MSESRVWYAISGYDAARELAVDLAHGLTADEVAQRRVQHGWNALTEAPPVPRWKKLVGQFKELVIWILIVAAIIAGVMGHGPTQRRFSRSRSWTLITKDFCDTRSIAVQPTEISWPTCSFCRERIKHGSQ